MCMWLRCALRFLFARKVDDNAGFAGCDKLVDVSSTHSAPSRAMHYTECSRIPYAE